MPRSRSSWMRIRLARLHLNIANRELSDYSNMSHHSFEIFERMVLRSQAELPPHAVILGIGSHGEPDAPQQW